MKGYVARKGDRWYAVIYEGLDPVTGRERRSWHPAGTERADAETLAAKLASERNGPDNAVRSLSFGAYLTTVWLPGKRLTLRTSTWDGYRRKVNRHILPSLGRIAIAGSALTHLEALYERLLHPADGRKALAPKSVLEVHLIIRGALGDAFRQRAGLPQRRPGRPRPTAALHSQSRTPGLDPRAAAAFLRAAAGHRLFPRFWLRVTGMRRNEVLGLRWDDIDFDRGDLSLNRGLVAVGYELHETRGKTGNARGPSTSTRRPSTSSQLAGAAARRQRRRRRRRSTAGCSPTARPTDPPPRHLPSLRAHRPPRRPSASSGCTTCATPTARCSSRPASRSRSSANGSATPPPRSPSRPTSTSCPACKPTPPASIEALTRTSRFYRRRALPARTPVEHPEKTA